MASKKPRINTTELQITNFKLQTGKFALYAALMQAIVATAGSLSFSEIFHFTPCVLCWYQRICMYPLVVILTVGILKRDKWLPFYVLPLTVVGWLISSYHNLLYFGVVPEALAPCVNGVSCTTKFFAWFGFITIPLLSWTAFSIINILMITYLVRRKGIDEPRS